MKMKKMTSKITTGNYTTWKHDVRLPALYTFLGFHFAVRPLKIESYLHSNMMLFAIETLGLIVLLLLSMFFLFSRSRVLSIILGVLVLANVAISLPHLFKNAFLVYPPGFTYIFWFVISIFFAWGAVQLIFVKKTSDLPAKDN